MYHSIVELYNSNPKGSSGSPGTIEAKYGSIKENMEKIYDATGWYVETGTEGSKTCAWTWSATLPMTKWPASMVTSVIGGEGSSEIDWI